MFCSSFLRSSAACEVLGVGVVSVPPTPPVPLTPGVVPAAGLVWGPRPREGGGVGCVAQLCVLLEE